MEALLPLTLYAFISSITPGPNNIMLTSSGLRFGFLRTVPHILGVTVGFCLMLALCAAGVGSLVLALPWLQTALKAAGSAYLLYLAWQLRRMQFRDAPEAHEKPMSFLGAVAFQAVNPKAWVMAVTGVTAFLPPISPVVAAIGLFCLVFGVVNISCISLWAGAGAALRRALQQPLWQKVFSAVMVVLTIYAALSIWN